MHLSKAAADSQVWPEPSRLEEGLAIKVCCFLKVNVNHAAPAQAHSQGLVVVCWQRQGCYCHYAIPQLGLPGHWRLLGAVQGHQQPAACM